MWLKAKVLNLQSLSGARQVIDAHYDLGNDLYMSFLDPYNQYTCGYFKDTEDLNTAQIQKMDLICRKLQLKEGDRILDIGCGWGGFAKYASETYGCQVTGLTLSDEQARYAREFTKGLSVDIQVADYRLWPKQNINYDKIVVVGMIEHVGYKNYRTFFEIVDKMLKKDGIFLLHTIGHNLTTTHGEAWSDKYIFPNGMCPSPVHIGTSAEGLFVLEDWQNFGAYYAKTLAAWNANFEANWDALSKKYPETFFRMFRYYFMSFAGSFRARKVNLWQIVFTKGATPEVYKSVR
jgi:cyclopropane-fatty-acyl-phospholipid synthase